MKIGIVTLPLFTNYGGILQAFALQKILKKMGHTPVTFTQDIKMYVPWWKLPAKWIKRSIYNTFTSQKVPIFAEFKFNRTALAVSQYTRTFIEKNIETQRITSFNDLKESDFDALIVGSDQIWRPMYFRDIENAYLKFAQYWNVKKIAYATSFGTDRWEYPPQLTQTCRNLVQKFTAVSVREISGVNLCQNHLQCKAYQVLDPTLLIDREEYLSILSLTSKKKPKGNLLLYILDESTDKKNIITELSQYYTPFSVNSKVDNLNYSLSERIQPPVEEWLQGFQNADFVFTDSFHACVFSIIFNKPFLVYGNKGRGITRFVSLLTSVGLEDRLVNEAKNIELIRTRKINWQDVNQKLNDLRNQSLDFLKLYLSGE